MAEELTHAHLLAIISYDADTGMWMRLRAAGKIAAGTQTYGSLRVDGYFVLKINKRQYRSHRLAWFFTYGKWPVEIDHINGNRGDNRLCNLREATRQQNTSHRTRMDRRNTSGVRGVYWDKRYQKWRALIRVQRTVIFLGRFASKDDAARARTLAEIEHFGEFR